MARLLEGHANEPEMQQKLTDLKLQIDDFYKLGRETAAEYIDKGSDIGKPDHGAFQSICLKVNPTDNGTCR